MHPLLFLALAATASGQLLTPVWVQLGDSGRAVARVVVNTPRDCPSALIGNAERPMLLRQPVPEGLRPVCEVAIPSDAKAATVKGQKLALPHPNPSRIVVLGDTGCRVKGARTQDCNDPAKWPFEALAARAVIVKTDLVIHVGDFVYREDECPAGSEAKCGGTPPGDRWETWQADFFKPAAKLLAATPWAFSRGNHEDCGRAWKGWFYYLDPRPLNEVLPGGGCQAYPPPYVVRLGSFELVMLDSSAANDSKLTPEQVTIYAAQLASLKVMHAWLADHHPFWGMRIARNKQLEALTQPLQAAWEKASPHGIDLILSGHTHLFEILSFDKTFPPQIVAGDGGTDLAEALPRTSKGVTIRGSTVVSSENKHEWGFVLLTRERGAWHMELRNAPGRVLVGCRVDGNKTACVASKP
jgi:hypothetical protein